MTNEQARYILHPDTTREAVRKIQEEQGTNAAMEAVNEACVVACEALDKQILKKPHLEGDGYCPEGNLVYDTWYCPNCNKDYEVDYDDYDYCPNCGQAIDWSDKNA